jgi:protein O-mannosyl-transferase
MSRPLLFLIAAAVPLLLYARTVTFDFVRADDLDLIVGNQVFLSDLRNVPRAFGRSYFEVEGDLVQQKTYYRPIAIASFMVDAARGGPDPAAYHVTNIALHAAAAGLIFWLATIWGAPLPAGLAAAVVFAVHPVNTQAVAWIAGRNDLLLAMFGLLSLICWTKGALGVGRWALGVHCITFALAVFSKETGFLFLPIALLYQGLLARAPLTPAQKLAVCADAIVVAVWAALRSGALAGMPSEVTTETARVMATNAPQILVHVRKMLIPIGLNVAPGVQDRDLLLAAAALVVLGIAASRYLTGALTRFAAGWVLLFLVPTLAVPGLPAYEHRAYLPLIGIVLAFAVGRAPRPLRWQLGLMGCVFVASVVVLAAMTFLRQDAFRSPFTYWTDAARDPVFGPLANVNLGQLHEAEGRLGEARREYLHALERDPGTPKAHNNLGVVLMKLDEPELARRHFQEETQRHPWNADAWFNLGLFEEMRGDPDAARAHYERAITENRAFAPAYEKLGLRPPGRN